MFMRRFIVSGVFLILWCFQKSFIVGATSSNLVKDCKLVGTSCIENKTIIKSDRNPFWSDREHDNAEKASIKFVSALKNKDMKTISEQIMYPLEIFTGDEKLITFTDKKELSSFEFSELFDNKFVDTITESKELFSNWGGFMLGSGPNCVWFSPFENEKDILIYAIMLDYGSVTEK